MKTPSFTGLVSILIQGFTLYLNMLKGFKNYSWMKMEVTCFLFWGIFDNFEVKCSFNVGMKNSLKREKEEKLHF